MIREANTLIEKIVRDSAKAEGTEARVKFVDAYASLEAIDFKNSLDSKRRIKLAGNQLVDNRYLDGRWNFPHVSKGTLIEGGYQSIDGMHASGLGYADMASRAMQTLGLTHTESDRNKLLQRGFDEDTLLSKYPMELDALLHVIDRVRRFIHTNDFIPETTETLTDTTHFAVALPLLASSFTR